MIVPLTFEQQEDKYVATFVSEGDCVIELEREDLGRVSVYANIPEMEPVLVKDFPNPYTPNVIFCLRVVAGLDITIHSATEVSNANIFYEE